MNRRCFVKKIGLAFVAASPLSLIVVDKASAQPAIGGRTLGQNVGSIPKIANWWFQYGYLHPRNAAKVKEAVEAEKSKMKPGEIKRFRVIVAGEGDGAVFQYLDPVSSGLLLSAGCRVQETIVIAKPGSGGVVVLPEIPAGPSNESFERWRRNFPGGAVDYKDYKTVFNAIVDMCGKGALALSNKKFYAPVDGTVILLAQERDSKYKVYDVAKGGEDPKAYDKGSVLSKLETTVWILSDDKKYVSVFSNLESVDVKLGDRVVRGRTELGSWKRDFDTAAFQLYRVYGPEQYFLNDVGNPKPLPLIPRK